jgi:DNA-binding SARP family transcriptional activator/WD40 repeat protein
METNNTTHATRSTGYRRSMKFGVLGPVRIENKGRHLSPGGPKQRTVLALLIARAGEVVSTDALMQGVYGDDAPPGSRRSVQTYISNLRGEIGDVITATGSGYTLVAERSEVDAFVFEDMVDGSRNGSDPEELSSRLREALALWRGHPYADVDGMAELTTETARLNELRASALEERVAADLELGRHRDLVAELESLTEEYPLRERFRSQQMLALYRCGRQAEALRAYEKTRTYLVEEVGLDPSRELRDLEQRILEQDPALAFERGPTVRRAAVLVADVADPRMLPNLDPGDRAELIRLQSEALEDAAGANGGTVFAQRGSAMYLSFDDVDRAAGAASAAQQTLAEIRHPMRMAISVGEVQIPQDGSVQGPPVTRAAQLVAAVHGGQVLLSIEANQALVDSGSAGWIVRSLGQHDVDGSGESRAVYQLMVDGLPREFPPLRSELLPPALPIEIRGLPGYELREQVGSGAFGVVHRAYQPSVGREVAIKIIKPEYANDPDFVRHFEVEAQLVARLEHPHIVPLHDYWRTPEGAYLVMRWLGGGTLADKIATGSLTIDETHDVLADIGPALDFAHRRGVVHRDIKASNVLLDDEGGSYLSDFGIASDVARHGAGSVARDVQALAVVVSQCVDTTDEPAVAGLLSRATAGENFPDVRSFIAAWEEAVGAGGAVSQVVGFTQTRNPYKGLSAFGELDAPDFHGRAAEIDEIIGTLSEHRLVAVVGPSGIGKSSVVRAGMIPALRSGGIAGSDRWLVTDMLPGSYPYEELASALIRVATEMPDGLEEDLRRNARGLARAVKRYVPEGQTVLLIVDQFEELFTLAAEDERSAFLAMLAATINDERSTIRIVITMRADFFDRPLRFADLGDALRSGTIPISAPDDEALHAIVTEPAAGVGVAFEPGLVDRIVSEVKDQPGALPLLEFSLTELFEQRDSDLLTLDAYEASGGVLGALGRRAESIYASLDSEGRDAARETFLRLVNVSEVGRDTRRRVRLSELERLGFTDVTLRGMLYAYATHRLLTFDRDPITRGPTVEVAHEAILTEWPRLNTWIDEHREDLHLRSRLAVAVGDWEAADRSDDYLLTGGGLAHHEAWTSNTGLALTDAEREILSSSRSAEDERKKQRRRNRRLVMLGFGAAALVGVTLAGAALLAQRDAQDQAELAESNARAAQTNEERAVQGEQQALASAREADGRSYLAASAAELEKNPELAMMLALYGTSVLDRDSSAIAALREAASASRTLYTGTWPENRSSRWLTGNMAPDGTTVAVSGGIGNYFEVRDIETDTVLWSYEFESSDPEELEISLEFFDGGAQLLAAVYWVPPLERESEPAPSAPGLYAFDVASGTITREFESGRCGAALAASESSQTFGANETSDSFALVTHYSDGFPGCGRGSEPPVSDVYLVDLTSGTRTRIIAERDALLGPLNIALSADGSTVIYPTEAGDTVIVDVDSGDTISRIPRSNESVFALSADGSIAWAAAGGGLRFIEMYDSVSGALLSTFNGDTGEVFAITITGDERTLITSGSDGLVRFWDIGTGQQIDEIAGSDAATTEIGLGASDARLIVFTKGETWTVVSLDPSELSEGAQFLPCQGSAGTFNLKGGTRVQTTRTLVYALCRPSFLRSAYVWDRETGSIDATEGWDGQASALSPDGSMLVAAPVVSSDDEAIVIGPYATYDPLTGSRLVELEGLCRFSFPADVDALPTPAPGCELLPEFNVSLDEAPTLVFSAFDIDFSDDARFVAAGSWESTGMVWNATTGERLALVPGMNVAFPPSASTVAFFDALNAAIRLYETTTFEMIAELTFGTGEAAGDSLVFSPDGAMLFGTAQPGEGSSDVVVYDGETLEERGRIDAPHEGGTRDIAVSTDGTMIATGGSDGRVRIWDIETLELLMDIPLGETRIQSVNFADGDTKIVAATGDGRVLELILASDAYVSYVRSRLTRGFSPAECDRYFPDRACPTLEELRSI